MRGVGPQNVYQALYITSHQPTRGRNSVCPPNVRFMRESGCEELVGGYPQEMMGLVLAWLLFYSILPFNI